MSETLLLVGKIAFLALLYMFIFGVVRSTAKDLRLAAPPVSSQQWRMPGAAIDEQEQSAGAATDSKSGLLTLNVLKSPCVPTGAAYALPAGAHAFAGRSSDMDIFLEDTFVSAKHVLFEVNDEGLWVEDLRSTNGTLVNGRSIHEPTLLSVGDRVSVGDTIFQVKVR